MAKRSYRIIGRSEAIKRGLTRYFTGLPCKHGHIVERNTFNHACVACSVTWKKENKHLIKRHSKIYYWQNRIRHLENAKQYAAKNQKRIRVRYRLWSKKNKDYLRQYQLEYGVRNADSLRVKDTKRARKRRATNIEYKLREALRSRLFLALRRGVAKRGSFVKDLGCTVPELRLFIESKFKPEMTWSNWGSSWDLDHIKPLHKFLLSDREQFVKAAHFTNLQPLLIADHKRKTARELSKLRRG